MDPLALSQMIQSFADAVSGKTPHGDIGEKTVFLVSDGRQIQPIASEQLLASVTNLIGAKVVSETRDRIRVLMRQVKNLEQQVTVLSSRVEQLESLEERLVALEQSRVPKEATRSDPFDHVSYVSPDSDGNIRIGSMSNVGTMAELRDVTMVGNGTVAGVVCPRENVTAIGSGARPTGNHQVVLGDHRATLHTLIPAHRRADIRDMFDARPVTLGLDFVNRINVLEYQHDFRESYLDWRKAPRPPAPLRPEPTLPELAPGETYAQSLLVYHASDKARWKKEKEKYEQDVDLYNADMQLWKRRFTIDKVKAIGTNASRTTHVGFNGRQVLNVLNELKKNMGLVQAHEQDGGESTTSLADGEMLAILWKAVQELNNFVTSDEFADSIASDVIQKVGG